MHKALVAAVFIFFSINALAVSQIAEIQGGGAVQITNLHDGKALIVDATTGNTVLEIQDISALSAGFHLPIIFKKDDSSNLVGIRVKKPGDKLNFFWSHDAPYPLWINLTQGAAELICDGVNRCHLMGKSFHTAKPQSQRTYVSLPSKQSFNVQPQESNEIIEIDASSAAMGIYFDPVGHFTRGGYLSAVVEFVRLDTSPNTVTLFASSGQQINGGPSISLNSYLQHWRCYIDSARITCR